MPINRLRGRRINLYVIGIIYLSESTGYQLDNEGLVYCRVFSKHFALIIRSFPP